MYASCTPPPPPAGYWTFFNYLSIPIKYFVGIFEKANMMNLEYE
jgi:hypothetical protein